MAESVPSALSRRKFLRAVVIAAGPVAFLARVRATSASEIGSAELESTPAAGDQLKLTPEETAGPFFQPNSPLRIIFANLGERGTGQFDRDGS